MKASYKPGDIIDYRTFDGTIRRVIVEHRDPNIKNGEPGFDGRCVSPTGQKVWGYDRQIVLIVK